MTSSLNNNPDTQLAELTIDSNKKEDDVQLDDSCVMIDNKDSITFTKARKRMILILVAFAGILSPLSSVIYFPSLLDIEKDLNAPDYLVDISVSSFLAPMALSPLIWGTLADAYGRSGIYRTSLLIFVLSSIACGFSVNIEMLICMRIMQGIGSSSTLVTGMGTISDIFPREERGSATGLFLLGPLIGTSLGPLVGGFLNQYLGWRSIFWFLSIIGTIIFTGTLIILPETLPSSRKLKFPIVVTKTSPYFKKVGPLLNPLLPFTYMRRFKVSLLLFFTSAIFASNYFVVSVQSKTLTGVYHLSSFQVGLCYLPLGFGNFVGSISGGRISDYLFRKEAARKEISPPPEIRLIMVLFGTFIFIIGLFMTGWFLQYHLPLPATLFSQFLIGLGMFNVFSGTSTYFIDLYPHNASAISACTNCLRTLAAAIVTACNSQTLHSLDYGWSFSLFGFLQVPGIVIVIYLIASRQSSSPPPPS